LIVERGHSPRSTTFFEVAMARSEHLPIYKQAYDLCLYFEQVVQGFSCYHKPALRDADE
jgi:hypothetical protein